MENTSNRKQIDAKVVNKALIEIGVSTAERLNTKGHDTFQSTHEILGIIAEEYWELIEAIKAHGNGRMDHIKNELLDIATACHFAIACINQQTLSW